MNDKPRGPMPIDSEDFTELVRCLASLPDEFKHCEEWNHLYEVLSKIVEGEMERVDHLFDQNDLDETFNYGRRRTDKQGTVNNH